MLCHRNGNIVAIEPHSWETGRQYASNFLDLYVHGAEFFSVLIAGYLRR
jgi:hypothetical protein